MNCSEISTLAPLYLAKELDATRMEACARHLERCAACRDSLAQEAACDEQLRSGVLAERLDASSIERHVREAMRVREPARRWVPYVAIAATLLLGVIGYQAMLARRMNTTLAAAAQDHRTEIVDRQPRKWITDASALGRLAEKQGFESSAVTAYAPAGYRLAQGRLCFLNGQVFLHLVYMTGAGNFSLFLRRPGKGAVYAASGMTRGGTFASEHAAGFQKTYLTAVVVTEQPGDIARNLANSASAAL